MSIAGTRVNSMRAAVICRRFFLDGASKVQIADELGISRFKVARILHDARTAGIVHIHIDSPPGVDLELSERLSNAYRLRQAAVVDVPVESEPERRRQLGLAAAGMVSDLVTESDVLGIGWGRSLDEMTRQLAPLPPCPVVQMAGVVGAVTESAVELVRRVSLVSGGPAYPLYTPLIVSDAHTASAIRSQPQVAAVLRRFADITIAVVAIGSWDPPESQLRASLPPAEQRQLLQLGVRAELCSTLLNKSGTAIVPQFTERSISISATQLRSVPERIGVAGGRRKAEAIRSVLAGGYLTSLITDTAAAGVLLRQ